MNKIRTYLFSIVMLIMSLVPLQVFAHGTRDEHQRELFLNQFITYSLAVTALLSIFFIFYWVITIRKINTINVRKKEGRIQRDKLQQKAKIYKWLSILSVVALLLSGGLSLLQPSEKSTSISFPHIHGLDFTENGKEIYVPAHDGLRVYADGQWVIPEGKKNDYMGFSMVDDGFYSSGHPGPDSKMKNPFGVVKSTDGGKTIEVLDKLLYGVIDFHRMDAGYESHAVYVINPKPNTRMDETGLHYTTDETKTWTQSKMNGLEADPLVLAVHPAEESIVAVGTEKGVFLSNDYGNTFKNVMNNLQLTALSFDYQGMLLVGGVNQVSGKPVLLQLDINTNESTSISIPTLTEDAVQYVSQSPTNKDSFVFTTFKNNIYLTKDGGQSWTQLAEEGKGISIGDEEN
jgi:photosystem II stability/assembly factor-like uncharacterized protein